MLMMMTTIILYYDKYTYYVSFCDLLLPLPLHSSSLLTLPLSHSLLSLSLANTSELNVFLSPQWMRWVLCFSLFSPSIYRCYCSVESFLVCVCVCMWAKKKRSKKPRHPPLISLNLFTVKCLVLDCRRSADVIVCTPWVVTYVCVCDCVLLLLDETYRKRFGVEYVLELISVLTQHATAHTSHWNAEQTTCSNTANTTISSRCVCVCK